MAWKNTHRWVKHLGRNARLWLEEDENAAVEMTVSDEHDSVSIRLEGRTKGTFAPEVRSNLSIRISYADLKELVHEGQEILVKHADEVREH
jgi:hypothetical protein